MLMASYLRHIGTFPDWPRNWSFPATCLPSSFYTSTLLRACPIFTLLPWNHFFIFLLDTVEIFCRNSCKQSVCETVLDHTGSRPSVSQGVYLSVCPYVRTYATA
jgi:hypothetical protein